MKNITLIAVLSMIFGTEMFAEGESQAVPSSACVTAVKRINPNVSPEITPVSDAEKTAFEELLARERPKVGTNPDVFVPDNMSAAELDAKELKYVDDVVAFIRELPDNLDANQSAAVKKIKEDIRKAWQTGNPEFAREAMSTSIKHLQESDLGRGVSMALEDVNTLINEIKPPENFDNPKGLGGRIVRAVFEFVQSGSKVAANRLKASFTRAKTYIESFKTNQAKLDQKVASATEKILAEEKNVEVTYIKDANIAEAEAKRLKKIQAALWLLRTKLMDVQSSTTPDTAKYKLLSVDLLPSLGDQLQTVIEMVTINYEAETVLLSLRDTGLYLTDRNRNALAKVTLVVKYTVAAVGGIERQKQLLAQAVANEQTALAMRQTVAKALHGHQVAVTALKRDNGDLEKQKAIFETLQAAMKERDAGQQALTEKIRVSIPLLLQVQRDYEELAKRQRTSQGIPATTP